MVSATTGVSNTIATFFVTEAIVFALFWTRWTSPSLLTVQI